MNSERTEHAVYGSRNVISAKVQRLAAKTEVVTQITRASVKLTILITINVHGGPQLQLTSNIV